ncbi:PorP/SprF family type IX secretion system membrane protein [Brumimicrobium sp.]|uniref:PorP/SprF family type IX secretion system membrane protein n=1 Tax=Brumimicrobium sp. TaxID=2029867 RepID=UPI003A912630
MKPILLSIALFFCFVASAQQGKNFSMFSLNNMQHNPAAVGTNDNDIKVFANFRYQYFTVSDKPFQTISASGEIKLFNSTSTRKKGYFGVGASVINDMSGDGRYMVNNIAVPIAYHIYMNERNSLSLGVSPGMYQRTLGSGNLTWESQWNGYEFDQTIAPGVANSSAANFDLGAGLFYKFQSTNTNKIYFGVSANHILQPEISFNMQDKMYMRYTGQFGMRHKFELSTFGISPQILAMFQGPNQNILFGSNFDFYLQEPSLRTLFYTPTIFSFGVYHRLRDAIVVNFQFSFKGMTVAASYDSNINSMLPASKSIGGFEVAFVYDLMLNKKGRYIY